MFLIVANWKCNPTTFKRADFLFNSIKKGTKNVKNVEIVICPPFPYLSIISNRPRRINSLPDKGSLPIKLGAQDCFWEKAGAFTGEISPLMLKDLGCEYVILGHSEKRKLGESDEIISKKIKAVFEAKMKPILCIGERKNERKEGKTFEIVKKQLKNALRYSTIEALKHLVVAYEPVWAIGTGKPCQPEEAKKVLIFLRKKLKGGEILYGGSLNSKNAIDYIKKVGFNGLLVGGASLNAREFIEIVKSIARA